MKIATAKKGNVIGCWKGGSATDCTFRHFLGHLHVVSQAKIECL